MAELTRRNFLAGSGMAVAGAVAATSMAAEGGANRAHADEQAAEGRVYQVITDELNPQDYDYRQNSGDLSHVLSPWKLGNMEFSNRIVKSAAGSNYENGGWDKFVEYYRRLAAGGTEMIWVENFAHVFLPYKNRINANIDEFTDEQITALTDAIHAEGAKCGNQLDTMASGWFSEITSRNPAGAYDAADMTEEGIEYTIQSYVDGVKQLQKWGFDAFELNCAGNNIPQWFLSPARNTRTDKYGAQTYESRTQFVREIVERIHAECGEDFPVQVLMNAIEENDESMGDNAALNTMEDGIEIAKQLEQAGVASLHLRLGTLEQHATQFLGDLGLHRLDELRHAVRLPPPLPGDARGRPRRLRPHAQHLRALQAGCEHPRRHGHLPGPRPRPRLHRRRHRRRQGRLPHGQPPAHGRQQLRE